MSFQDVLSNSCTYKQETQLLWESSKLQTLAFHLSANSGAFTLWSDGETTIPKPKCLWDTEQSCTNQLTVLISVWWRFFNNSWEAQGVGEYHHFADKKTKDQKNKWLFKSLITIQRSALYHTIMGSFFAKLIIEWGHSDFFTFWKNLHCS